MNREKSRKLFEQALSCLVGGVNSPVRAFKAVGGEPLFISRGKGSKIWDADGNEFIDYVLSWGSMILGHAHPEVVSALKEAAERGISFGIPTELEIELAKLTQSAFPSMELIRFVNSGTEAVMSALRLARAFTKREKIIKFAGCYHGHWDGLLVQAGSGMTTLSLPSCPGVPQSLASSTYILPYSDISALDQLLTMKVEEIAAVIVEPIAGNMGVVKPPPQFLYALRSLTAKTGSLLIFDEVITGFRITWGGVQNIYGIKPDLTCLGKIIGGGLPVGAYGGKKEIMEMVAPLGPVYQAGTLSGNPLAMIVGIKTLEILHRPGVYQELEKKSALLEEGLANELKKTNLPAQVCRAGSMLTLFFTKNQIKDYNSALSSDTRLYARFFWGMLERGIYLPPSQFEAMFLSLAHSREDIEKTIQAASEVFSQLAL